MKNTLRCGPELEPGRARGGFDAGAEGHDREVHADDHEEEQRLAAEAHEARTAREESAGPSAALLRCFGGV